MITIQNFGKVKFGAGALATLGDELTSLGIERPLLATEAPLAALGLADKVTRSLKPAQRLTLFDAVTPRPTAGCAEAIATAYRAHRCDAILALGGGVVIDVCKAAAVLVSNKLPLIDYAGHPERITAPLPMIIAIPTTAGTGSEVSCGAGIHPAAGEREFGLRHPALLPHLAICDPDLTRSLPPGITAGTGLDALGHCVEACLSSVENPIMEAIALDGIRRALAYLERAVADGHDSEAREQMMMAALQGGMAISKGLGCAHALSMTFSNSDLHHGAVVAIALPTVLRFVADRVPGKLARLADAFGVASGAAVAPALADLNHRLGLPATIAALGYGPADHHELACFAAANHFNQTSPKQPGVADYEMMIAELMSI